MIDTNPTDPGMERKGVRDFFYSYFYANYLQNIESVEEAIQEYLDEGSDLGGEVLRREIHELIAADMTEEELKHLIEKVWQTEGNSRKYTYKRVLQEIIKYLDK
jgi:hypothetical protein